MNNKNFKYSLWVLDHESGHGYSVYAEKVKDTNSIKEVDEWIEKGNSASFYREEDEINAMYLQLFEEY